MADWTPRVYDLLVSYSKLFLEKNSERQKYNEPLVFKLSELLYIKKNILWSLKTYSAVEIYYNYLYFLIENPRLMKITCLLNSDKIS